MKVNGQLERAQLEQLSALPTPGVRGRVFTDISAPTNPIPMFDTGSALRPILLGQSDGVIPVSLASGVATVDWSQGLNQKLILTSSCVVRFTNPQEGSYCNLLVQQSTTNIYSYTFDMPDQDSGNFPFQPGILYENEVVRHAWFYKSNTKLAVATVPAGTYLPPANPASSWYGVDISPDGKFATGGQSGTPYAKTYSLREASPLKDVPFWSAITPVAAAGAITTTKYAPNGKALFLGGAVSPYIQAVPAYTGTFDAAYANPGTLPTGTVRDISVHPTGLFVAVGHATTPFMSVYPWTSKGFGTKLANPGTLPAAQVNAIAFSPDGNYLATGCRTTPFIRTYAFNTIAGTIGAAVANPTILPADGPAWNGIAWRPQGDFIAMSMNTTPYLYVIPFNTATGTYGTPLSVPNIPAGAAYEVKWSLCGSYLLVCCSVTPGFYIYDFTNHNLSTLVTFSSGSTNEATANVAVDPTNTFCLLGTEASSFAKGFPLPNVVKNYTRIA